jgi:hypothetical protein
MLLRLILAPRSLPSTRVPNLQVDLPALQRCR